MSFSVTSFVLTGACYHIICITSNFTSEIWGSFAKCYHSKSYICNKYSIEGEKISLTVKGANYIIKSH